MTLISSKQFGLADSDHFKGKSFCFSELTHNTGDSGRKFYVKQKNKACEKYMYV